MKRAAAKQRAKCVGIRQAKSSFSHLMRRVRRGETIEITDRGERIARLTPIDREDRTADESARELIDLGLLIPGEKRGVALPRAITQGQGPLASEVLRKDRREDS